MVLSERTAKHQTITSFPRRLVDIRVTAWPVDTFHILMVSIDPNLKTKYYMYYYIICRQTKGIIKKMW